MAAVGGMVGNARREGGIVKRRELTAFVREVVLPAGPDRVPKLDKRHIRFRVEYRHSKIHRWGLFALEPIPAGRRVIEYTGERIDEREAERRSVRPAVYLFRTGGKWMIDGAVKGSGAEFINHSCEPNMVARISRGHIWLVSLRRIEAGEELSYNYKLAGGQLMPCRCGAKGCWGFVNPIVEEPR